MKKLLLLLSAGLLLWNCEVSQPVKTEAQGLSALRAYMENKQDFSFSVKDSSAVPGAVCYRVRMNSGKWLNDSLVALERQLGAA